MMSESIGELAAALVAAQKKLPKIHKGETANVGKFSYSYADLTTIKEKCDPILHAEGLAVTQWPSVHDQGPALTTMLVHTSGQWISDQMLLLVTDRTSQGQGSGITYGKRYAYCAVVGIAPDKDDDGAQASVPAADAFEAAVPVDPASWPEVLRRMKALTPENWKLLEGVLEENGIPKAPGKMSPDQLKAVDAELKAFEGV